MKSFKEFNLSPALTSALEKMGYISPSPVQSRVIPKALQGKRIVCQSETGSGKTHSYLIPILQKIDTHLPRLQSIIICPSRELARQVYDFAFAFTRFFPTFKVRLFSSETEIAQNKEGQTVPPQMIVGTPGRLKELLSQEYVFDLHGVRSLVLDEADMLLELGYFQDIDEIYQKLPENVQTMVFSATMNETLKLQLEKYIGSEFLYEGEEQKTSPRVAHHFVDVRHVGTVEALSKFLDIRRPYFCLVFASKKEDVKTIYEGLKAKKYSVTYFSGDLDSRERKQVLKRIRADEYQIVVCSDLLSRGIDLDNVTDVISVDLPMDLSYYYHRAGRTGRFDKTGDSWVFYNVDSLSRPKELLSQGLPFDYYILKNDRLEKNELGLDAKKKFSGKKKFSEEELKEVKIAKAKTSSKTVKPGYKKKQMRAVEKVKNKYRRKAIQKSIKAKKDARYAQRAKQKLEGK